MTKVILISGKQGSGKTTTADELAGELMNQYGDDGTILRARFAQPLYEMHNAVLDILKNYGITRNIKKDGPLLQLLGTEWGRKTIDENIWAELTYNKVMTLKPRFAIIDDARFENEFDIFPAETTLRVRLDAPEEVRKERCSMWRDATDHPSEVGLDRYADMGEFDLYCDSANNTRSFNVQAILHTLENRGWIDEWPLRDSKGDDQC